MNDLSNHLSIRLYFEHVAHKIIGDKYSASKLKIIQYQIQEDNTYLVSFPRTGSHWLRMILELYFERPLLTRTFYYPHRNNYLLLHTHDMDLQERPHNVIYLYRDPVDTVYSQLNYYREDVQNKLAICHWSQRYAFHLIHWLIEEKFTINKTIVRFELLKKQPISEFEKIVEHFEKKLDTSKLEACLAEVSKQKVKQKTAHDNQVVDLRGEYEGNRERFREQAGAIIYATIRNSFELICDDSEDSYEIFSSLEKQTQ